MGFAYDQVLYPGFPLPQTHPDRLATIAGVLGMTAAPPDGCRVLELGCGDGGNLIPMALGLPHSQFTGIDLAEQAVARGQAMIQALGLGNILLRQMDLTQVGADLGKFDYILAHGVYSWVPAEVRDALLRISRVNLAPHGVAYISYNAYPGFHRREMFREMMLHDMRYVQDPALRYQQAVQLVEILAKGKLDSELSRILFEEELQHLSETAPWVVYHDDLAGTNRAFYFHEVVTDARRHQLQYLAEADFFEMQTETYPEPVREALERFAGTDIVAKEQYLDFIKGRRFRQTLLCREEVVLHRSPRPDRIMELYVASEARPASAQPDLREGVAEEFRGPRGALLQTDSAVAKAALCRLVKAWPQSIHFSHLSAGDDAARLAEILFQGYRVGLLELHTLLPQFASRAGEHPVASPLARLQVQHGAVVTTLRHTLIELDDAIDRSLLLLLDGTRNREALMAELRDEEIEMRLSRLAREALLLR